MYFLDIYTFKLYTHPVNAETGRIMQSRLPIFVVESWNICLISRTVEQPEMSCLFASISSGTVLRCSFSNIFSENRDVNKCTQVKNSGIIKFVV